MWLGRCVVVWLEVVPAVRLLWCGDVGPLERMRSSVMLNPVRVILRIVIVHKTLLLAMLAVIQTIEARLLLRIHLIVKPIKLIVIGLLHHKYSKIE